MRSRARNLLEHPILRTLLFERLLLTASAALAMAAVLLGRVRPEIPGLMDWRLLALFFVLTVAVELGKHSDLFDRLVAAVVRSVRSARALALALIAVTGVLAMLLTNDVALLLAVPFTLLLRRVPDLEPAPFIVLEIASANLFGAATPIGNPQNLFLFARGGFTTPEFLAAQLPFVAGAVLLLALAVPFVIPGREFEPPATARFDVDPLLAAGFFVLLAAEIAAIAGVLPWQAPLLLSVPAALALGRRIFEADFSLVLVFALLFVGVAGLERGRPYHVLDSARLFAHGPTGLLLSGALLSQFVSNVPAAMLLSPTVRSPAGFTALLYGVNSGGCGTPIASLANLIGAQLYLRDGGRPGAFWRRFLPVSFALLAGILAWSLSILRLSTR
jgi:Na+/H+ antiporter NhaD/arsenite permease-like protein